MTKLEHKFHKEFEKSVPIKWTTLASGRVAGEVRSAGGDGFTAGNVTFVQVYEAGHMVPFDQPEAALVRPELFLLSHLVTGCMWRCIE